MARLSLRLFGPFHATLDGDLITAFRSDKARALLVYLVVEAERPHHRERLAGLLWPEWPERDARGRLRRVLSNLRLAIGDHQATPPFLHVSRQTIQFNTASDAWVDVGAFTERLEAKGDLQQLIDQLEGAVDLYRGDFLEGFSIPDSASFEEWALLNRERFRRLVMVALSRLVRYHEQRGNHEGGLRHAWRQVELEPWHEKGHQQVMRLLALSGQRGAALAQYETCRRLLAEELGVEPGEETTRLYEQIRDGDLKAPVPASAPPPDLIFRLPRFLQEERPHVERPVFVAREQELARLDGFLETALQGEGKVVFVTGGAGWGKTALVDAFAQRAMETHPDLLVAGGHCNAHTGVGDPYLPFREILALLTSDVDPLWAAGAISRDHARRLWHALPLAVPALVDAGPDLVDTFVPGPALMRRAEAFAAGRPRDQVAWLAQLEELVDRKAAIPHNPSTQQSALFQQYARMLAALARERPLLLVVDDLQWVDGGSNGLLFHLGRGLAGARILIVGAYRPEEVVTGRPAPSAGERERHPLEPLVNEFQRTFGDIAIDLDRAEERRFVDEYLASEPNRLSSEFHETLCQQTGGHPLFTVELLHGMRERGDLVQDEEGHWIEGPALDWETLPPRVEAVIEERIARLNAPLREALRVASVEGETFTAEVVAQVEAVDEGDIVSWLSRELDRQHRLVSAQGVRPTNRGCLSQYRFRHILFQRYLYGRLDPVERARLHRRVGTALERLHGEAPEEIESVAVQLARHFQEAGVIEKAIDYLRQAGERAVRMSAFAEAIAHFRRGLRWLDRLPDSPARAQQELALQLGLAAPLQNAFGLGDPEVVQACARARELCGQLGETFQLFPALWHLTVYYTSRAEFRTAHEVGEQLLRLAEPTHEPLSIALAHLAVAWPLVYMGELSQARAHTERTLSLYDPQLHQSMASLYGMDIGLATLVNFTVLLWCLGYPDQAFERSRETLSLARKVPHSPSLAYAQAAIGAIHMSMIGDVQTTQKLGEACIRHSTECGLLYMLAAGLHCRGWALAEQGCAEEGIVLMHQAMEVVQKSGVRVGQTMQLLVLAGVYAKSGQVEAGLTALDEALVIVDHSGERPWEPEIHRLKGELLLMQGAAEAEVETHYWRGIELARQQSAKSWELRATTSLCRLWQQQGKRGEARELLGEIYDWFTEGFDTPDLQNAKTLLDALA
jgi:DNA-binding SARP family transcriptional activator/tetratricopeptide (TPR) repeat protein